MNRKLATCEQLSKRNMVPLQPVIRQYLAQHLAQELALATYEELKVKYPQKNYMIDTFLFFRLWAGLRLLSTKGTKEKRLGSPNTCRVFVFQM